MVVMILLLGFIAFLPGYLESVEERLRADAAFKPLSIISNLKRSKRARPFLTWFGLFLIWLGSTLYVFFGIGHDTYAEDTAKIFAGFGLVWIYFVYGFCLEEKAQQELGSFSLRYQWFSSSSLNEWCQIGIKATKSIAIVIAIFVVILSLKAFLKGI